MGTFSFRKAQKLTRELRLLFPTLPFLISPTDVAPKQPRRGERIIESALVELRLGVGKLSVLKSCVYCFPRWTAKIRSKGRAQYQGARVHTGASGGYFHYFGMDIQYFNPAASSS